MIRKQQIVIMGVDFGLFWEADFENAITYKVRCPAYRLTVTRARHHAKMIRTQHIIIMGVDFGLFWAVGFDNVI